MPISPAIHHLRYFCLFVTGESKSSNSWIYPGILGTDFRAIFTVVAIFSDN